MVSARKSLASSDHIMSMIDGKKYRSLKRHLTSSGLTPAQYRERYKLKAGYPIDAPAYSEARRAMAKTIRLGRKAGTKVEQAAEGTGRRAFRVEKRFEAPNERVVALASCCKAEHLGRDRPL